MKYCIKHYYVLRVIFFRQQHPTNVLLRPAEALQELFFRLNGILSYEMTAFMLCASTTQILRSLFRLWKGERGKKRRIEGVNNSNYIWYWQTLWLVIAEKTERKSKLSNSSSISVQQTVFVSISACVWVCGNRYICMSAPVLMIMFTWKSITTLFPWSKKTF